MRKCNIRLLAFIILAVIFFIACKKTEQLTFAAISDYAPLVPGKYITYQLDSLIFADNVIPYNRVYSYQVKQLVMDTVTDNLGRKGFSIRRYIRKSAADTWVPDNTFFAINTGKTYEFIENNLRYLKLTEPLVTGGTWKGNGFIDTRSSNTDFQYLDNWDYTYDSLNTHLVLGNINLDSTLKVAESDYSDGYMTDATFHTTTYSSSNYSKGIGLVYHRFFHEEYQPPTPGTKSYSIGYGVTLTMVDHN